ncbi:MAG: LysR family transcriptional regulator [Anaerohalosphaera sp.]|nr:LysR family transcriptional regulator [Anaerohalosphaera sp.]
MDFDTLRIFCDVAELKNFSRAAEKNGISQSAVSQQIAQLELKYKCQLIDRKTRPLALTKTGQIFYNSGKDIMERYNRLTSRLSALSNSSSRIYLAAIFSIGMHDLQPYVKEFMTTFQDVNLSVEYCSAQEIYDGILDGQFDIGAVAEPRQFSSIKVYPFEDERLMLVCGPENPLSGSNTVNIHQIQGQKFIAFEQYLPSRNLIDGILHKYNVSVRTVMEFDNVETIKRAVEIDAGISILPEPSLRTEIANGSLKAIALSNEKFTRTTGIIVRRDKTLSQAAKYLIQLLTGKSSVS